MEQLTPLEGSILQALQTNEGDVVLTDTLIDIRFQAQRTNEANRIATHIKNLRRKLSKKFLIQTVRGEGYRLVRIKN